MKIFALIAAAVVALGLSASCEPEHVEKKTGDGWVSYTVGVCETQDGLEPERSCAEAKVRKAYCCECDSGTQYTAALCSLDQGCATFGEACAAAKGDVCK